jgi:hypothetical protein
MRYGREKPGFITHSNGCAAITATRVINVFFVLVLLTPWLCGQNPDELLVVRLPARHGHINEPGVAPIPFPTVRGEIAGLRPSQKFRHLSVRGLSIDDCRHQARKPGRAKRLIGRLQGLMLKF